MVRTPFLCIATFVVAGCASATGQVASCRLNLAPNGMSLAEVVDSAALQRSLEGAWPADAALALASLHYDSLGNRTAVHVRGEALSEAAHTSLESVVEKASLPTYKANQGVYLFLGNREGPAPRRVGRFPTCKPSIIWDNKLASRVKAETEMLRLSRRVQVYVGVLVGPDGTVERVRIERSSGIVEADLAAARVIQTATFRPAVMEGMRVPVWMEIPITLSPRSGGM